MRKYRIMRLSSRGRELVAVLDDQDKAEKFLDILRAEQADRDYPVQYELTTS